MTQEELDFLRNWRALPEKDRKDYARRIGVLALAYREPVPDEQVTKYAEARKAPARKRRATV